MRILLLLTVAFPAFGCDCGSYDPIQACEIFHKVPIIFRGRVIDHNHDEYRGIRQETRYRVQVLERFKGLADNIREVFIDPGSWTSCYREFETGADYLVYAGSGQIGATTALTVIRDERPDLPPKPTPDAWRGLQQLPVFRVSGCSPTRALAPNDPDLPYLRATVQNPGLAWIEGRAVQNYEGRSRIVDHLPVPGARITITSRGEARQRLLTNALPDGSFRIGPVEPGFYWVSADSLAFASVPPAPAEVQVPEGGCGVAKISLHTGSTISGKVLDANGRPAPDFPVELGELRSDGSIRVVPWTYTPTTNSGEFKIANAPLGRIVLGANLAGAPTPLLPFEPVFFPDTQSLSEAQILTIQPRQELTGLVLRLPEPLAFGDLYVDVKWPDGSPAVNGARAFAQWSGARAAFEYAPRASNRVKLRLALQRTYSIRVDWFKPASPKFLHRDGAAPQSVEFKKSGQTIELRLESPPPQ